MRKLKDKDEHVVRKEVPILPPILDYNQDMGGLDRSDQAISYYNILKKTRKYWHTLFSISLTSWWPMHSYFIILQGWAKQDHTKVVSREIGHSGVWRERRVQLSTQYEHKQLHYHVSRGCCMKIMKTISAINLIKGYDPMRLTLCQWCRDRNRAYPCVWALHQACK